MASKVVCAFGRFQPPTRGHDQVVAAIIRAANERHADAKLFLSQTQNSTTDPLPYRDKLTFARLAWGATVQDVAGVRTPIDMVKYLYQQGYRELTYVAGQDRVGEFEQLFKRYNGGADFKFTKITVVSAGMRDPDAPGIFGVSASKLRDYAAKGLRQSFLSNTPANLNVANGLKMYYAVRSGLGLLREQASPPPLVGTDEIVQRYAAMTPGQQTAPGEVKRKVLTVFKALKIAIRNANHARERDASDFL